MNDIRVTPTPDRVLESRLGIGRKGKRRRRWLWAGLVLLALGGGAWFYLSRGPAHTYVTKPVARGTLAVTVSATGTLAPRNQVDVGAEVSGRIDRLNVDFNDHVKKGEVLALINTDQYLAQLQQAQASLAQAEATLQQSTLTHTRYAALGEHDAISRELLNTSTGDLARAVAGVKLARAQVQQDQTLLSYCTIYSPIDGVVLDRKVSAGQTVASTFSTPVLYTLASDLSQMELDVDIDEADIGLIRPGAKATFTVDAYPTRVFLARLFSIHNAPKTVQGVVTYQGVLREENVGGMLKPGMTATAEIEAATIRDALLVPNAALRFVPPDDVKKNAPPAPPALNGMNGGRVWTENGKTLKPHDIRLGATDGHLTQVLTGDLKPGDEVVTDLADKPPKQPGS
ncbi:MAG TPA: efflux RND transporter periplasmic adaptor subunit [Rhizomicrobium sp.]|jgi:HlyD family secretion protein|nr:efflux RND transporter periplasmic adaptor subunit [Rhizomicrobium sp.]